MRCRNFSLVLAALLLSGLAPLTEATPTLQDMQIAARVLHFQYRPVNGRIVVAIVYNAAETGSHDEAVELVALLGDGLGVGDLTLQPRMVEQAHLSDVTGYDAVFAALAVNQDLLTAALKQRQIPCLTRHTEQVEHGSCIVAIRSQPRVSIIVNMRNAVLAGVRFATAFCMMVEEV